MLRGRAVQALWEISIRERVGSEKDIGWKIGESIVGKVKVDQGGKVCKAVRILRKP
jgi:hypothetical protein